MGAKPELDILGPNTELQASVTLFRDMGTYGVVERQGRHGWTRCVQRLKRKLRPEVPP
jgi:hypothetical protein